MKGYKHTELGWIPDDWDCFELSEITQHARPVSYGIVQTGPSVENGVKCIRVLDIVNGRINDQNLIKTTPEISNAYKRTILKEGDLVIALRGKIGELAIIEKEHEGLNLTRGVALIAPNKNYDSEYLKQQMSSALFRGYLTAHLNGSALKELAINVIRKLKVPSPKTKAEQYKIGSILNLWDVAISDISTLILKKQQLKKGLMQQLFSCKKRLPVFKGKWKKFHLGSLGEPYTGLTGKSSEDFGSGKPYIPFKNIFSNSKVDLTFLDYVRINENENQNRVQFGDIFFTVSSETPEEVGMASVLLDEVEDLYLNSFCFGFRLMNFNILLPEFARFYMESESVKRELYKLAQGSTRFNLSKSELMKIHLFIPSELEEQISIARMFSNLEYEVKGLEDQLMLYEEQKKGLTQQLLTGRKRLKD